MKGVSIRSSTKGLLPFEEKDVETYYIDEALIEEFFRCLKKNKFVFLKGDQGTGKTSFLSCIVAGQIGEYLNVGEYEWETTVFRPGLDPVKNLAHAIARANITTRKPDIALIMEEMLRKGSNGIVNVFNKYPMRQNKNLLLVIDNLEDIFFLEKLDHDARIPAHVLTSIQTFVNLLWTFDKQSVFRVYIVAAFSNTFRERIAEYPKLLDLAQKYDFRFDGVSISETDKIIDKVVSPLLKTYTDIARIKQNVREKLRSQQENGTLNPAWRFSLNHALRRTLILWNRSFNHLKEELLRKHSLSVVLKSKYLLLLVNDLLRNERMRGDASFHDKSDELWSELTKQQQQELLAIIRTSRSQGKCYSIVECYEASGGLEKSVVSEADELFSFNASYDKLAEFLIRSLTTKDGELRPLQYQAIKRLLHDRGEIDEERFQRFIGHFGNNDFGFLQIVSSSRIEERLNVISNTGHVDDEAVISIRNSDLLQEASKFQKWVSSESECISEYLLYAQMSKTDSETYPTTLKLYADALLAGGSLKKDRHSAIIHEFLQKGSVWAALHTSNKAQYGTFEETRGFINKGIKHWQLVRKSEENRRKEERRIRRVKRNLILLVFLAVTFFGVHTRLSVEKHNMLQRLDCIYDDYLRISYAIYSEYVQYLESGSREKEFDREIIQLCNEKLIYGSEEVDRLIDSIYLESVLSFTLNYAHWSGKEASLLSAPIRRDILQRALNEGYLKSKGGIIDVEGYKIFTEWLLPRDTLFVLDCTKCETPPG